MERRRPGLRARTLPTCVYINRSLNTTIGHCTLQSSTSCRYSRQTLLLSIVADCNFKDQVRLTFRPLENLVLAAELTKRALPSRHAAGSQGP